MSVPRIGSATFPVMRRHATKALSYWVSDIPAKCFRQGTATVPRDRVTRT